MLVSRPLCEKTHISADALPLAGRAKLIGLPPRVQVFEAVINSPSAATLISRLNPGTSSPAVVGSTTEIFFSVATGASFVKEIISGPRPGATTSKFNAFEDVPSGFRTCTDALPVCETSAGVTGAVHCVSEAHEVIRAVPAIQSVEPDPGALALKPLPFARSVKPFAPPV